MGFIFNFKTSTKAQDQFTEALTKLFDSGEDSDFTVQCGNVVWKLHRVILRAGSEYFRNACQKDRFKARISGMLELKDDDSQVAGLLLRYFYTHDYQVDDNGNAPHIVHAPLVVHAHMYAIADKYGVTLLKDIAKEKFTTFLQDIRSKGAASLDIPAFATAIGVIYTTTLASDRGLRDAIVPVMVAFETQLRASDDFMALIRGTLADGDFAVDVIDAWADMRNAASSSWSCGNCGRLRQP
ncbi:hypothetical protein N7G274_002004 [Stereocaulon virgatum]|uniref:BTB domain-containing protein n=1 Tax=Stereocaulon virgatum TaxID=373712 RepID=A0ABR4AL48_9LECA